MDQTVKIILQFVDQATGPVQGAAGAIGGALGKLGSGAATATGGIMSGFAKMTQGIGQGSNMIVGYVKNLADHMRWASLFIGTAAIGIGASFVQMAGGLEQTRIGFETLLKDDAKVKDALNFIQQWALETPFSVTEATDSFKRFLAVTGDLQLTKKYLKDLGDAVVATGGNINEFNFAARAMTQIQAMSKVRAQEMYQLVNANIPAFDILAKAIKDGKLQVEGLSTATGAAGGATKKLTNAYQKATENQDRYNKELKIAEQRLKEVEAKTKKTESSVMAAKLAVEKKAKALHDAQGTIVKYNEAQTQTAKVTATASMSLEEIKGELQNIGDLNIKGAEAAKIFSEYFEQAYGGAAAKSTTTLIGKIGVLKDQFVFAAAALVGYNQKTGETYGLFKKLGEAIDTFNNFLITHKEQFEAIGKFLEKDIGLYALLGGLIGVLLGFVVGILGPVLLAGVLFGALGVAIGKLIEWFRSGNPLAQAFAGALAAIGIVIATVLAVQKVASLTTSIISLAAAFGPWGLAILAVAAIIGIVTALIITHWDEIKAFTKQVWTAITKWLSGVWDSIKKIAGIAWEAISLSIITPIKNVIEWVERAINKVGELIQAGRNLAKEGGLVGKLGLKFQHGGIVPGPIGAPMPIMAHGGERVIPRTGVDNAGGGGSTVTININGPLTLDSPERVQNLADQIIRILGRQNELARFGVGYNFV